MTRPRLIGLPWYRGEDYARLRSLLVDGDRLPAFYDLWRVSAEQIESEARRSGLEVVRIEIEPEAFAGWCDRSGLAPDAAARSRFVQDAVRQAAARDAT